MILRELNSAQINAEKFNQQISFLEWYPAIQLLLSLQGDRCISECELPMRFGLPCKCWLFINVLLIKFPFRSHLFIHGRFYKGPPFVMSWKMSFDATIIVEKMLVLASQLNKMTDEDTDLVVEDETHQLDSPRHETSLEFWTASPLFYPKFS